MTISDATNGGSRREILLALRDKLAHTLDECESGRDIAALSKRLMEVCAELDAIPDPAAGRTPVEEAREKVRCGAA